jgi:hypothetical protein
MGIKKLWKNNPTHDQTGNQAKNKKQDDGPDGTSILFCNGYFGRRFIGLLIGTFCGILIGFIVGTHGNSVNLHLKLSLSKTVKSARVHKDLKNNWRLCTLITRFLSSKNQGHMAP